MFLNQLVPNKVTHCSNGRVAILTALTSRVTFNLTVQVVYLRNMTNGLGCNENVQDRRYTAITCKMTALLEYLHLIIWLTFFKKLFHTYCILYMYVCTYIVGIYNNTFCELKLCTVCLRIYITHLLLNTYLYGIQSVYFQTQSLHCDSFN